MSNGSWLAVGVPRPGGQRRASSAARPVVACQQQGAYNQTRVREAQDVVAFASQVAATLKTDRVFLLGDLNAYTHDPEVVGLKLPSAPDWSASGTYITGDLVYDNGSTRRASWWTRNQVPSQRSGPWKPTA